MFLLSILSIVFDIVIVYNGLSIIMWSISRNCIELISVVVFGDFVTSDLVETFGKLIH